MKRPAFQFYPADWRKDLELQSCGIAARGLWHEMLCVMHEAKPYGFLFVNGQPMTEAQAATACRVELREYRRLLKELLQAGVPSVRESDGAVYSRRMVKDETTRTARAAGGEKGGGHGAKGREHGRKGGRPAAEKGAGKPPLHAKNNPPSPSQITPLRSASKPKKKPPLKPPPSSSSSSSSSASAVDVATPTGEVAVDNSATPTATAERKIRKFNGAPHGRAATPWMQDPVEVKKQGARVSVYQRPNEAFGDFLDRVLTAQKQGGGHDRKGSHA